MYVANISHHQGDVANLEGELRARQVKGGERAAASGHLEQTRVRHLSFGAELLSDRGTKTKRPSK